MLKANKARFGLLVSGVALGALAVTLVQEGQTRSTAFAESDQAMAALPVAAQAIKAPKANVPLKLSFADMVEQVSPAVVSVLVEREVQVATQRALPPGFERFFGFPFGAPEGEQANPFGDDGTRRAEAQGSGFFIDADGHVVTNHHVVEDADAVQIQLADGTEVEATVIGSDPYTDLAVLKVEADKRQPYVNFAKEMNLRVGDWVVAVGNPFGLGGTVTTGIVSAIGGQNREQQYVDLIQVDAAINRGNSGGPTFDLDGNVVGVNVAIYSPNGGNVGIGFAIPADTAEATIRQLIEKGAVTRGWLGISLDNVTRDIADALELGSTDGVLVADVLDDTPAAAGGLENGDVITAIDGNKVRGPNDLSRQIAGFPPDHKIKVSVVRDGKTRHLSITLGKRDDEQQVASNDNSPSESTAENLGVRVSSLTDANRMRYRIPDDAEGVVVTAVKPNSPAERTGLAPGVVIAEVDNEQVTSPRDFTKKIETVRKAGKGAALLRLQRGDIRQYAALRLDDE